MPFLGQIKYLFLYAFLGAFVVYCFDSSLGMFYFYGIHYILCTGGGYYVLYTALLISKLFRTEGCMDGGGGG